MRYVYIFINAIGRYSSVVIRRFSNFLCSWSQLDVQKIFGTPKNQEYI